MTGRDLQSFLLGGGAVIGLCVIAILGLWALVWTVELATMLPWPEAWDDGKFG